ncbi:MAG: hypothetical protein IIZ92_16660 [Aquincola sp.]|uniref:Porin n=1 Tax=Aquincola tertiaricarbonis TaxID=391953 RepID=A0ABY4S425_AQUTE|nr:hypothetical protein [Aquincola tertiaricarbonis]MBQ1764512.1 hypothetical protein [Aquincola sp.]URI07753.1 hypothetical protein MW290_03870 [Aquincola tertiaricarbonis]|tara:strand:- start:1720 stop:2877 length:1158 start_codon:yes stop_codon:yes gene_type:complete
MAYRDRICYSGATALVAVLAFGATASIAQPQPLELTGSLKSVYLRSKASTGEDFALSLNRLRVEAKGDLAPGLAVDLQYDNEVLLGSYLDTAEFRALKDRPPPQYWRADANYVERGEVYGRHRLYRAAVTLTRGNVDLKLGRQRIAWGTGRFWSPLDILNPVNPLALEREERVGVDAALLEAQLGPLSRASLVVAPAPGRGPTSSAVQWHGNAAGVDASLVAGRLLGLDIVGMDLATQIRDAGIRGEAARLRPRGGPAFNRLMVGGDYAFANGLTLSAELYYNGAGSRDPAGYDRAGLRSGRAVNLATRYTGLYASYEITPLLKWVSYAVRNADDRSRAIDSRLVWSIGPAMDLTVGVQHYNGTEGSEFAAVPNAVQLQLQWFFR